MIIMCNEKLSYKEVQKLAHKMDGIKKKQKDRVVTYKEDNYIVKYSKKILLILITL